MNKQDLIGLKVQHNTLGEGTIKRFKGDNLEYCLIYFERIKKESMFRFPDVLLDHNTFNQDNDIMRMLRQQLDKIENEYSDNSDIEHYVGKCIKCGREFRISPSYQIYLDKHSKEYPKICKSCSTKEKQKIKEEKRWRDSEQEFAFYRSLMYSAKPCSSKRSWIHDTDGMSV